MPKTGSPAMTAITETQSTAGPSGATVTRRTSGQNNLKFEISDLKAAAGAERRLMERVIANCDGAIRQACGASSVPAAFLAALVANESGGDRLASRFEPAVYAHLAAVLRGERPNYGSISRPQLEAEIQSQKLHIRNQNDSDAVLRALATSWGYTQIMGYHAMGRNPRARAEAPSAPLPSDSLPAVPFVAWMVEPHDHFHLALVLLAEFAQRFQLDPARDFAELFHCWNTGQPYGPPRGPATYDPRYLDNGLRRMEIYARLANHGGPSVEQ